MTGTSGAIEMATVSRTADLPLTGVDFTDSRTRTRREARSTHTISPAIVFEEAVGTAFDGVVAAGAAADFVESSGVIRSARRRTKNAMGPFACTRRARSSPAARAASGSKIRRFRVRAAPLRGFSDGRKESDAPFRSRGVLQMDGSLRPVRRAS